MGAQVVNARRLAVLVALVAIVSAAVPSSATAALPPAPPDPTCSPAPTNCFGWHNAAAVTVQWASPPPGVIVTGGCITETITSDTAGALAWCRWANAEGSRITEVYVRRDATAPSATASPTRGPDSNGWYNRALTVKFSGGDALSGLAGCTPDKTYAGPDSGVGSVSGSCTDAAGNSTSASFGFQYDATAPSVEAKPDRKPNRKGWYNRAVKVAFVGSDATSGVKSCAPDVMYGGPDIDHGAVAGTCTDHAANTSAAAAYELRFDSKAPALWRFRAGKVRGGGVLLRWKAGRDATGFVLERKPGLDGARSSTLHTGPELKFVDRRVTEGVRYLYKLTAYDEAGNPELKGLRFRPEGVARPTETVQRPALTTPLDGARVSTPPLLDWNPVPRATYYNVQLFRNGKKVLTAWPTSTSFRLARTWRFDGRRQTLLPGRYRWYVWPGFGSRSDGDYGKPVGTRTFVVTRG
jgi:hypothetical protein